MKKAIDDLGKIPNADATFKGLKNELVAGKISSAEFLKQLRTEFGDELFDSTYTSWRGVKQRSQKLHAADGIPLSPKFQKFHDFVACMGLRPRRVFTLDRVNGALGYTDKNCRWVDKKTQTENRSITVYATDRNGQCETLAKWAEITGTPIKTLSKRKSSGWSDPDIIHGRTPAPENASYAKRPQAYGRSARLDYSPSGDMWPPKTKYEWDMALETCGGWAIEDQRTALDYVKRHLAKYRKAEADYSEDIWVPDREDCDRWQPSEEQRARLATYSERIKYFAEWLRLARRAMFPRDFIPKNDIW